MASPEPRVEPIHTTRLELIPLHESHAEEMVAVLADPILYQLTGGEPPERDALRRPYRRQVAGSPRPGELWWNWVIRLPSEGCLVGFTQATVSPPSPRRRVEVAWVLGPPWQGHGYAREAAGALTTWLIARLALSEVVAHIHPDNHASTGVATSIGMTVTDVWRDGERRWRLVTWAANGYVSG